MKPQGDKYFTQEKIDRVGELYAKTKADAITDDEQLELLSLIDQELNATVLRIEGGPPQTVPSLVDVYVRIPNKTCKWCSGRLKPPLHHYSHTGGIEIQGYDEKQWVYLHCTKCDYDWAIWKLGYKG